MTLTLTELSSEGEGNAHMDSINHVLGGIAQWCL